jgi:hypothetical protein
VRPKTVAYVGFVAFALLLLAIGGWIARPFTRLRPRFA